MRPLLEIASIPCRAIRTANVTPPAPGARILEAARAEFCPRGLDGAWVEAIAARSGPTMVRRIRDCV